MSNKRYLELDSTYRNRNQDPNPSNFTVLIAQSGTRDAVSAYDPVCISAPIKTWVPDDLILKCGVINTPTLAPLNQKGVFTICFPVDTVNPLSGYYNGCPIEMNIIGCPTPPLTQPTGQTVIITSWDVLSLNSSEGDCFIVSVSPSFTSDIPQGIVKFLQGTDLTIGKFLIPDGFEADYYYVGYIMYNENLNKWRPIISYNKTHRLAGVDLSPEYGGPIDASTNPPAETWRKWHTYSIRKALPKYFGELPNCECLPYPFNKSTSFKIPCNTNVAIGDFIRFTFKDKKEITPPIDPEDPTYTYEYINISCRITGYTGKGRPAVPAIPATQWSSAVPAIPAIPCNVVTVDCCMLDLKFGTDMDRIINCFEILQFTRDNAVPFCYSGSTVSQQEMVCYEIKLINLVLPNKTLVSGGRVAFYPYVYVELQNVSGASSGNKCIIYSNNPNATKMLFRAAIDDIRDPSTSPFIKIDGDGMVQTIKFKPNDNLKFGVYIPNGQCLETVDKDCLSPLPADALLQVSATFEIKRL
jgi:hypothetical protein